MENSKKNVFCRKTGIGVCLMMSTLKVREFAPVTQQHYNAYSYTSVNSLHQSSIAFNMGGGYFSYQMQATGLLIFFVSNDHSRNIVIDSSIIRNNTDGSWYAKPGISMHADTKITITNSSLK